MRARIAVTATYRLPTHAIGDERSCSRRSDDTVAVELRTVLELRTGERFLRVRLELDHHVRDHRLRAHFPLPAPVAGSDAECAFAVVHRGLTAEGGPHEAGLPTFVSRRFVDCSDGRRWPRAAARRSPRIRGGRRRYGARAHAPARDRLPLARRDRAAPQPGRARSIRSRARSSNATLAVEYAVLPHRGDWRAARLADAADEFLLPLEHVRGGGVPGAGRSADRAGAGRRRRPGVGGAPRRRARALVIRLFNPVTGGHDRARRSGRRSRARTGRRPRRSGGRVVRRVGPARALGDRHPSSRLIPTWTPRPVSPSTRS